MSIASPPPPAPAPLSFGPSLGRGRPMRWRLVAAFGCALLVRVAAVLATRTYATNPWPQESASLGQSIARGEGLAFGAWGTFGPSSIDTPPQAALVALVSLVADGPWLWLGVMLTLCLAGAGAAWAAGRLARDWGTPAAALAAVLVALWPEQVLLVCVAQPMAVCSLLLLAALGLWGRGGGGSWAAGSGVAALAGFWMPSLLVATLLGGLIASRGKPARILILLVATAALWGPWTLRSHLVHEPPVYVTSGFWQDVYEGNNEHATGSRHLSVETGGRPLDLMPDARRGELMGQPEAVRAERLREWAWEWIKANPAEFARLAGVRVAKSVWLDWDDRRALHPVYVVSRSVWLGMTLVAIGVCLWRRWSIGPMLGVMAGALVYPAVAVAATGPALAWQAVGLVLIAVALAGQRTARSRFD